MKNKIILIVSSLILIPFWGLGLLSIDSANWYTALLTFLITGLCITFVPFLNTKDKISKILVLIGPVFYFLVMIITYRDKFNEYLISPITWIFLMTFLLVVIIKNKKLKVAITLLFGIIYTFLVYPNSDFQHNTNQQTRTENLPPKAKNIFDFVFVNNELDTLILKKNAKPILIETWNETCPPCIKSINDLGDELSNQSDFDFYYLYQQRNGKELSLNQVFNFKYLSKHKQHIILDIKNTLFDSLALNSYPYFLIFDTNGDLSGYQVGYNPKKKKEKLEELFQLIKEAN